MGFAEMALGPQWLKAGDEVSVEIEGLGRLTNRLVAPPAGLRQGH